MTDDFSTNFYQNLTGKSLEWHRVPEVLYSLYEGFMFRHSSFYYRQFRRLIDRLVDTGVMGYLTKEHYVKELKFYKPKTGPKVLTVEDLSFGFNIWLAACLLSAIVLIFEKVRIVFRPRKEAVKKLKFLKVHPIEPTSGIIKINTKVYRQFKMKPKAEADSVENEQLGSFNRSIMEMNTAV